MRGPGHPQPMPGERHQTAKVPDTCDVHCPKSPMTDTSTGRQMPTPNEIVATMSHSDRSLWKPQTQCPESDTAGYTLVEGEYLPKSRWRVAATPHWGKEHAAG